MPRLLRAILCPVKNVLLLAFIALFAAKPRDQLWTWFIDFV